MKTVIEEFDVECGGKTLKGTRTEYSSGISTAVPLPSRGTIRNTIQRDGKGWVYKSTDDEDIDYYFMLWLRENGTFEWTNDMQYGRVSLERPFSSTFDEEATQLYEVSREVEKYEKRDIPARTVYDLRKYYLTTILKLLGYSSIDAIEGEPDDTKGYLALNRVAEQLKDYRNIAPLVHCTGSTEFTETIRYTIPDDMTREEFIEAARPVKEQTTSNTDFMQKQEEGLYGKNAIISYGEETLTFDEDDTMKSKVSPEDWKAYSAAVKEIACLLLELNADLLTPEQRERLGIVDKTSLEGVELEDRISNIIDSKRFNQACHIENRFAVARASELIGKIEGMLEGVSPEYQETNPVQSLKAIIAEEKLEVERRQKSIDNYNEYYQDEGHNGSDGRE